MQKQLQQALIQKMRRVSFPGRVLQPQQNTLIPLTENRVNKLGQLCRVCLWLERSQPNWLVNTGQIHLCTALRLFAVTSLRLIATLAERVCACMRKAMLHETLLTPCSKANLPRSHLSNSYRKRSNQPARQSCDSAARRIRNFNRRQHYFYVLIQELRLAVHVQFFISSICSRCS